MARSAWKVGSLALLASVVGSGLLLRAWALQPQREAEQRGLRVRMERAVWLHEATDHGATAALPRLPGAPPAEARRLTVSILEHWSPSCPGRRPRIQCPGMTSE